MIFPLAWMLKEWSDSGFPPWAKPIMIGAFCAPAGYLLYRPMAFGLATVLIFGAYLACCASAAKSSAPAAARRIQLT
jgi:hypothetical protein